MKTSKHQRILCAMFRTLFIGPILMALLFQSVTPVLAGENDACVPALGGFGLLPNVSDGIVDGDTGWSGALRINLNAGTGTTRTAVFQAGRSSTDMYLSLVVDTPAPGVDNTIVIALSTDGNAANDWRIDIKPWDTAVTNGSSQTPHIITYWRNSDPTNGWNNASATATTAGPGFWLKDNTRFSKVGSRWSIEMKIPMTTTVASAGQSTQIYFPSAGTFRLYVNALSTSTLLGTVYQAPWPTNGQITAAGFLDRLTPPVTSWGTVSFNDRAECTGVSLAQNDIGVQDPNSPSQITNKIQYFDPSQHPGATPFPPNINDCNTSTGTGTGPVNTFIARPRNSMATDAPGVFATFKIANWGVPGASQWQPLPTPANPTTAATPVPGNNGSADLTTTWALTYQQSCVYSKANFYYGLPHQCILATIDSNDASVRFLNKSVYRNMDFESASVVSQDAEISAKGYGPPPQCRSAQEFVITVDSQTQKYDLRDNAFISVNSLKSSLEPAETARIPLDKFRKGLSEATIWIARAYRKTCTALIINGTPYEYAETVGSFGYVVGHAGQAIGWAQNFTGKGLEPQREAGVYTMKITPETVATVNTTIVAVDISRPWELVYLLPRWAWLIILILLILLVILVYLRRRRPPHPQP